MPARANLGPALVTLTEDAFFTIAGSARLDVEMLHALVVRRRAAAATQPPQGMDAWEPWVIALSTALAPIAPPAWLPMADAIEAGLSLEHGARGVRSLFTSKPSEKEVQRIRMLGSFAVHALGSVLAATGTFSRDSRFIRAAVVASLGLPEADQKQLNAEEPPTPDRLELQAGVDSKVARGIIRGAFFAAMGDGMDPREEQAVSIVAQRLSVSTEEVNHARLEAKKAIERSRGFGEAAVDAIRYVLEGDENERERFAVAAARLILPQVHRREAITAINVGGAVSLAKKHEIEEPKRLAVLGLAWLAALRTDPTFTRRTELAARHTAVAADLGDGEAGVNTRTEVERFLEDALLA